MSKNMVFTSAGDNTEFIKWWCTDKEKQQYDIYVFYYGKNEENFKLYESHVTYIESSEGSKFQNFYKFWTKYPEIINNYGRFFILDDDIEITCEDINEMFKLSKEYNLEICAPSFSKDSQINHILTRHKDNVILSYTNFVEVNTPLFSRSALDNLMKFYDPILIGWGIDILYIWANGLDKTKSYAIIHKIQCKNPYDNYKRVKTRELMLIKDAEIREIIWIDYAKKIGCPSIFILKDVEL
jgi:hypothetical protein